MTNTHVQLQQTKVVLIGSDGDRRMIVERFNAFSENVLTRRSPQYHYTDYNFPGGVMFKSDVGEKQFTTESAFDLISIEPDSYSTKAQIESASVICISFDLDHRGEEKTEKIEFMDIMNKKGLEERDTSGLIKEQFVLPVGSYEYAKKMIERAIEINPSARFVFLGVKKGEEAEIKEEEIADYCKSIKNSKNVAISSGVVREEKKMDDDIVGRAEAAKKRLIGSDQKTNTLQTNQLGVPDTLITAINESMQSQQQKTGLESHKPEVSQKETGKRIEDINTRIDETRSRQPENAALSQINTQEYMNLIRGGVESAATPKIKKKLLKNKLSKLVNETPDWVKLLQKGQFKAASEYLRDLIYRWLQDNINELPINEAALVHILKGKPRRLKGKDYILDIFTSDENGTKKPKLCRRSLLFAGAKTMFKPLVSAEGLYVAKATPSVPAKPVEMRDAAAIGTKSFQFFDDFVEKLNNYQSKRRSRGSFFYNRGLLQRKIQLADVLKGLAENAIESTDDKKKTEAQMVDELLAVAAFGRVGNRLIVDFAKLPRKSGELGKILNDFYNELSEYRATLPKEPREPEAQNVPSS